KASVGGRAVQDAALKALSGTPAELKRFLDDGCLPETGETPDPRFREGAGLGNKTSPADD
ncbi:ALF repeat-containing protein, partial [Streptomyces sp. NPDC051162]|uniref:ALF repeat-containing protein n=1 Tax=Streptomyces sp. NPDC051162 TaxID=3154747 RepID=UPI00341484AA